MQQCHHRHLTSIHLSILTRPALADSKAPSDRRKPISVNTQLEHKPWKCDADGCGNQGNFAFLMFGLLNGRQPTDNRLRGNEFLEVKQFALDLLAQLEAGGAALRTRTSRKKEQRKKLATKNKPLVSSKQAATRALVDPPLMNKLVIDRSDMSNEAATYVQDRPYLRMDNMERWNIGWMARDGGEDGRGKSLGNCIVVPFRNSKGEIIGFVGRDPNYEEKLEAWEPNEQKRQRPAKHRFLPTAFNTELNVFGIEEQRLDDDDYKRLMEQFGVIVTQDYMNVVALDHLGVPAFGICSSSFSDIQAKEIAVVATKHGHGNVKLMFDCNEAGDTLAKEALWKLSCLGVDVQLVWSSEMAGGKFAGMKAKVLSPEHWQALTTRMRVMGMDVTEGRSPSNAIDEHVEQMQRAILNEWWQGSRDQD